MKFHTPKSNLGISTAEVVFGVLVVLAFLAGIFIFTRTNTVDDEQPVQVTPLPTQAVVLDSDNSNDNTPTTTPTSVKGKSSNAILDSLDQAIQDLGTELEDLDQIETELELPEVDFSTDF